MRIRNAYVVNIDFDDDYRSNVAVIFIFTTLEEVKEIVKKRIIDLKNAYIEKYNLDDVLADIDGYAFYLDEILVNDELLEAFIECGGDDFGNWYIHIDEVV